MLPSFKAYCIILLTIICSIVYGNDIQNQNCEHVRGAIDNAEFEKDFLSSDENLEIAENICKHAYTSIS